MDHYREALRYPASRVAYDVLWRVFFVAALPVVGIGRAILWVYDRRMAASI